MGTIHVEQRRVSKSDLVQYMNEVVRITKVWMDVSALRSMLGSRQWSAMENPTDRRNGASKVRRYIEELVAWVNPHHEALSTMHCVRDYSGCQTMLSNWRSLDREVSFTSAECHDHHNIVTD